MISHMCVTILHIIHFFITVVLTLHIRQRSMFSWFGNGRAVLGFPLGGKEEFALFVYGPEDGFESNWREPALLDGMRKCLASSETRCDASFFSLRQWSLLLTGQTRLQKLGELATHAICVPVQEFKALDEEEWVHESGRMLLIGEAAHPYPVSWDSTLNSNYFGLILYYAGRRYPNLRHGNRRRCRPRQTVLPPPLSRPNHHLPLRI